MKRSALCLAGSVAALAAVAFSPILDAILSPAQSETFDARWAVFASTAKEDRLASPRPNESIQVKSTVDAERAVTTLEKIDLAKRMPQRPQPSGEKAVRKEKLPVGCDPSFSPVTVPSMAHVTGRCIAGAESGRRYAQLSE